ncbi:MAG: GNAT family N-acetyltransferase [candidate division WS1 bacterium]|jgi:N-acetylglutamate synthase-like GNAT family acetyltransferase|nr:GNAT family N-acetyltransferase [candidate division WS1 bacterium]
MDWELRPATSEDLSVIEAVALREQLDSRNARPEEFIIAELQSEVVGFGRLIHHKECWEIACLYVARDLRRLGLGTDIVNALLERGSEDLPVYAVTSLPEFFATLGFVPVEKAPPCMRSKRDYCRSAFEDKVTIMVLER